MTVFFSPPIPQQGWSLPFFQALLAILGWGHSQVLPDELAEKREVGKIKVGADLLCGLVAVAQLLAYGVDGDLMDVVKRRAPRLIFDAFGEILG